MEKRTTRRQRANAKKKDDGHPRISSSPIAPKPIQQQISTGSTSQSPKESTPVRVTVSSPQKQRRKKAAKKEATVQQPNSSKENVDDNSGSNVSQIMFTSI